MKINAILINPKDNVAVTTETIPKGGSIRAVGREIVAAEEIIAFHKVAVAPIAAGEPVIKYGVSVGVAVCDILPGHWVHTHNIRSEDL